MGYNTKQKNIILSCLAANSEKFLSAKEVFALCEQNETPVGLATIYRQLEGLAEQNMAKRIISADNSGARFQYIDQGEHKDSFFLKCDCCGKMTNADCGLLAEVSDHMSAKHGFQINTNRSVLYGRCKECK